MLGRLVFAAGLVVLFVSVALSPAAAHSILQGSSPRANAALSSPPRAVVLAFSEPVDAVYSSASVRDQAGNDRAASARVSADGRRMVVLLSGVSRGLYIVRWRVLSLLDGHTTAGTFAFSVGPSAAAPPPQTSTTAPVPIIVFRWLAFASALLMAGTVFFDPLVLRWSLHRLPPEARIILWEEIRPRLRALATASALVLLGAAGTEFVLQGSLLLDRPVREIVQSGVVWSLLSGTRLGWSLLLRASMALVILIPITQAGRILRFAAFVWIVIVTAVIIFLSGPAALGSPHITVIVLVGGVYALAAVMAAVIVPKVGDLRVPEGRWVPVAAALVLLTGFTLTSHAAPIGPLAVVTDWLHLTAASVWLGALPSLLLVLRSFPAAERPAVGRVLVPRVSRLAAGGLAVMILTGLYSAWLHVPGFRALVTTAYGTALLVKLVLVVMVVALGALNRFVLRPRIEAGTDQGARALRGFRRSASVEVALGAAILLIVALLTITPPASVTVTKPTGITLAAVAGAYRILLTVTPAQPGWNDFEARVTREHGRVLTASVTLTVTSLEGDREDTVEMNPEAGRDTASGDYLRDPGWWELSVTVKEASPVVAIFPLVLGTEPNVTDPAAAQLLDLARRHMRAARTWREDEQITDGKGNVAVTRFEALRPDRLRYRTGAESEVIIIGAVRYSRDPGGAWTMDRLPQPIRLIGPYIEVMEDAEAVRFGRRERCEGESCRIVLWRLPSASASFSARIGERSGRVYRVEMVAPDHYMISRPSDLNAPIAIAPP